MAPFAPMWYNMHFDPFLCQRYALCYFFAGSAERGDYSLSNCGRTNHVAALKEELRLSKVDEESVAVEEESTVAEVLTKAIRYMYTHLHFLTHRRTHRLHPSAYSTHNYSTTFPFRLNFIDVHHYMYSEKSSVASRGSLSVLLPFVCIMPAFARWCSPHNGDRFPSYL